MPSAIATHNTSIRPCLHLQI